MSVKDYVIAPSILSANFAKLGEEVANVMASAPTATGAIAPITKHNMKIT